MRPEDLEQQLKNLTSLSSLRSFLADLGFQPMTKVIIVEHPEIKDIKVTKIAESATETRIKYPVILIETAVTDSPRAGRELAIIERKIFPKLHPKEGLLVTMAKDFKRIHLTNVKPFGKRLLFRRFSIGEGERYRTTSERLSLIKIEPSHTFEQVKGLVEKAFDVEKVTEKFFHEFQQIFRFTRDKLESQKKTDSHHVHSFTHQLFNRIMFLYFLQRMGWLGKGNQEFMMYLWMIYQKNKKKTSNFYREYLTPLFFGALSKPYVPQRHLPKEVDNFYMDAPYLNGGLFTETELDQLGLEIPDEVFDECFGDAAYPGFLQRYNFTIHEESPWDMEVAVDPAMLGKVYESLTFSPEERSKAGIIYTPRIEIDFMCKRALLDYLKNNLSQINERKIYRSVFFEEPEKIDVSLKKEEIQALKKSLETVTIIDPAVGSGSFLVGIMEIIIRLIEYLNRLEGRKVTAKEHYELKKKIIERSLYGVDTMDWAIQVAQLRMWLQLIIDAPDELKKSLEPILPSLSYKLRTGDSLVQEIVGHKFPLILRGAGLGTAMTKRLSNLKKLKLDHYENKVKKSRVDQEEKRFFSDLLFYQKHELENLIIAYKRAERGEQTSFLPRNKQLNLPGDVSIEAKLESLRTELGEVTEFYKIIQKKKDLPFIWGIGFAEIFSGEKGGFDIVVGNPPYVRQEKIANPIQNNPTLEQKRKYKQKLLDFVQHYWNKGVKIQKKADLYVYFYLISLALLNSKGAFCFITSNSWLDVGYGKELQESLLKNVKINAIYDNQAKRTFASADINTIIVSFSAKVSKEEAFENKARFVMFSKPFEDVLFEENIWAIDHTKSWAMTDDYRLKILSQEKLLRDGWEYPKGTTKKEKEGYQFAIGAYAGNKWGGKYLRAPDIYWKILEKGKDKLVRLGDIAEIRRGFTTGANEFFYVEDVTDKLEE